MHDTDMRVEDRLRAALRAEADDLPFTITVDRLARRALERRRTARATRLGGSLAAAAAVVVAVGIAAYALVNRDTAPAATPPTATASTASAIPTEVASFEELLPLAAGKGIQVGAGERIGDTAEDVSSDETGVRTILTVVAACVGDGDLELQVTDGTKPYARFRQGCTGEPVVHATNGAPVASADGLSVRASAPAGTDLRFVVVGVPSGPLPDPNGLIETDGVVTIPLTTATSATIEPDEVSSTVATYRVPVDTAEEGFGLWVGLVCQGAVGHATWRVEDAAGSSMLGPVDVACDGIPSYDRAEAGTLRPRDPSTALTLVLETPRDAGWALSAVRLLPPGHPDPTVPCQAADPALTRPPKVEFFQAGAKLPDPKVLGSWKGQGGDSSADVAPETSIPLASGKGLTMRIADDVCAIRWRITYAPVPPDLVGHVPAGDLVPDQDNPRLDPAYAVENEFALADVPSGEWWIQALLVWPDGSAYVNLRVTVP